MKGFLRICFIACLFAHFHVAQGQVPVITSNPRDTSVCVGNDVTLTVAATNNPTGYVWQYQYHPTRSQWYDISPTKDGFSGQNTNQLTIHSGALNPYSVRFRCIAVNAEGSSIPSTIAIVKIAQPHPNFTIWGQIPVCRSGTAYFNPGLNLYIDSVTWTYTGSGITIHYDHTNNNSPGDSVITIDFSDTATMGILSAVDSNACGVYGPATLAITISPELKTVAGAAGYGPVCGDNFSNRDDPNSYTIRSTCAPLIHITASGPHPLHGYVTSCVTVDSTVQSYGGIPYVQRHYNIEPNEDPSASTATLTLYYTQSDFDNYNLARGSNPALPANSTDAAGIANLRITQFHGTGTAPGTYTGTTGEINPDDNKIIWNATDNRWEVTFDIIGFSGFYVSTGSLIPLPLTLTDFNGQTTTNGNLLQWITASEQNTAWFEIQRHTPGSAFTTIAKVSAAGNSRLPLHYQYTDNDAASDTLSYRLKMVDLDGGFTYSKTVVLQHVTDNAYAIRLSPNPYHNNGALSIIAPTTGTALLTVTDISGRLLFQQRVSLSKGNNPISTGDIDALPSGTYLLSLLVKGHRQTVKLVKY
ncbi:MAG: T9SS type A sorting domain-containing protein [Chitinophagaceae bacterium]|nr:T9SS type A sorting domain-containing protein [Chitinophagaceae bacterium]